MQWQGDREREKLKEIVIIYPGQEDRYMNQWIEYYKIRVNVCVCVGGVSFQIEGGILF